MFLLLIFLKNKFYFPQLYHITMKDIVSYNCLMSEFLHMHQLPTRADQMIKWSTGADQLNDKKDYKSYILGWQGKGF